MRKSINYSVIFLVLLGSLLSLYFPVVYAQAPTSFSVEIGVLDSGNIDSILTEFDGDFLAISEVAGVPGYDIRINFTGVNVPIYSITMNEQYAGANNHEVCISLWNYTSSSWVIYFEVVDSFRFFETTVLVPNYEHHVSGGIVQMMICHEDNGNTTDDFFLDYVYLDPFFSAASRGELLAALLVVSLILVPLLILIIFAARRKQ